jgi:hypothetical protein
LLAILIAMQMQQYVWGCSEPFVDSGE